MTYDYINMTYDFNNQRLFDACILECEQIMNNRDFPEGSSAYPEIKIQELGNKYYKVVSNRQTVFQQRDIELFATIYKESFSAMRSAELAQFVPETVDIYDGVEFDEEETA